jgi:hypothetical protein
MVRRINPMKWHFVDQFIQGMGVFSVLFDKIPISTTDVEEDSEEFELHLNQIFRQDNSKKNSLLGSTSQKIGLSDWLWARPELKKGDDYLITMSTLFNRHF